MKISATCRYTVYVQRYVDTWMSHSYVVHSQTADTNLEAHNWVKYFSIHPVNWGQMG